MTNPDRRRWNGKATMASISIISALVGIIGGSVATGAYFGSIDSKLESHLASVTVHETPAQKETRIRTIIDREVTPTLQTIQRQLDRIEKKIDKDND